MGGFRAGTNYLRYLLEVNYRVRVNYDAYGWKHAGVPFRFRRRRATAFRPPILAIAKNPFAYVVSLHRYYNERGSNIIAEKAWDSFLTKPFVISNRSRERSVQYYFANPVQYWNFINWNLTFTPKLTLHSAMISYDALLCDPQGEVSKVAEALNLRRKNQEFRAPDGLMRRLGSRKYDPNEMFEEDKPSPSVDFYLGKHYLEFFSETQRRFVASHADRKLCEKLGFSGPEYNI